MSVIDFSLQLQRCVRDLIFRNLAGFLGDLEALKIKNQGFKLTFSLQKVIGGNKNKIK